MTTTRAAAGSAAPLDTSSVIPYGRAFVDQVRRHGADPAVIAVASDGSERSVDWNQLEELTRRAAVGLRERGVGAGSMVVVALANGIEHVACSVAAWRLGACVLPLNPRSPAPERDAHLELAGAAVVVAEWDDIDGVIHPAMLLAEDVGRLDAGELDLVTPMPGKAIGTGGSTGRPKLIVQPNPWGRLPVFDTMLAGFGWEPDIVHLVASPLYHNYGFDWCYHGLVAGHTIVLLERFDAALAVDVIERHRVQYASLVPTMMLRMCRIPDIDARDLSSLHAILHTAGPCAPWVKQRWIDLIGAHKVIEGYGASEGFGNTVIRGDEWLAHRGSVGLPYHCELRILDAELREVPSGEIGEVYMRRPGIGDTYRGEARARITEDGFGSVGDLGWVDGDGYLYLADRRVDMIVSGGHNVYPAEVEAALLEHPEVADAAVIGLLDDDLGRRVHAVVQPRDPTAPPTGDDLTAHLRARIAGYKVPRGFEFVTTLPRDDGGKLRRAALVSERSAGSDATATTSAEPSALDPLEIARFAGTWDGPVEITGSAAMLRVHLQPLGGETAPSGIKVLVDCDACFGVGVDLGQATVVDGELCASSEQMSLRLAFHDGELRGVLRAGFGFGEARVELRHGHPGSVPHLIARIGGSMPTGTPRILDDDWAVESPASAGIDVDRLRAVVRAACEGRLRQVDAILVAKGGHLVVEEYFFGRGPEHLHTIQSSTKSVTSLLAGTLVDDGLIRDVTDPVWQYLPSRRGRHWIDEKYPVTVHQVLSMSAGLDWNEGIPYTDPRNDAVRMNAAPDWVGYVLDRALRPAWPEGRFEYQSGLSMLLGELIRALTGRRVDDYARDRLFAPLHIGRTIWGSAPGGTVHTGGGLFMRPRDLLKLGQLVLDGGRWAGTGVVSESWIQTSTFIHSSNEVTDYGYQWWLPRGLGVRTVMARGYGGQTLAVLPELDAVIVSTGNDWFGNGEFPTLYTQYLLPLLGAR